MLFPFGIHLDQGVFYKTPRAFMRILFIYCITGNSSDGGVQYCHDCYQHLYTV